MISYPVGKNIKASLNHFICLGFCFIHLRILYARRFFNEGEVVNIKTVLRNRARNFENIFGKNQFAI